MHTNIHTYIHTYSLSDRQTDRQTDRLRQTDRQTYRTYIHTIHTYIHYITCIYIYIYITVSLHYNITLPIDYIQHSSTISVYSISFKSMLKPYYLWSIRLIMAIPTIILYQWIIPVIISIYVILDPPFSMGNSSIVTHSPFLGSSQDKLSWCKGSIRTSHIPLDLKCTYGWATRRSEPSPHSRWRLKPIGFWRWDPIVRTNESRIWWGIQILKHFSQRICFFFMHDISDHTCILDIPQNIGRKIYQVV